jgi:hypothetical protein
MCDNCRTLSKIRQALLAGKVIVTGGGTIRSIYLMHSKEVYTNCTSEGCESCESATDLDSYLRAFDFDDSRGFEVVDPGSLQS